jgi:hypothetical protein
MFSHRLIEIGVTRFVIVIMTLKSFFGSFCGLTYVKFTIDKVGDFIYNHMLALLFSVRVGRDWRPVTYAYLYNGEF